MVRLIMVGHVSRVYVTLWHVMPGNDRLVQVSRFYEKLILVRRSKARLFQVMTG
jgi:hypothetical protein